MFVTSYFLQIVIIKIVALPIVLSFDKSIKEVFSLGSGSVNERRVFAVTEIGIKIEAISISVHCERLSSNQSLCSIIQSPCQFHLCGLGEVVTIESFMIIDIIDEFFLFVFEG